MSFYPGQRVEFQAERYTWCRGTLYGKKDPEFNYWWDIEPHDHSVLVYRVAEDGARLSLAHESNIRPIPPLVLLAEAAE